MAAAAPLVSVSCTPQGDGPGDGSRLIASLGALLGSDRVVPTAQVGAGAAADARLEGVEVMLAVIAPGWEPSEDAFAGEVRLGLQAHIPVIPVLTRRATMPARDGLPDSLQPLLARHPRCTIDIPADPVWDVVAGHLASWLRAIGRENRKRAEVREAAARTTRKHASELERARQQLATARSATATAEQKREQAEEARAAAQARLTERQQGLDPGRTNAEVRVFVSYRSDTSGHALTLQTELQERLSPDRVSGTEQISTAADPAAAIAARIARCDAVLAVVGPTWMGPSGGEVSVPADDTTRLELKAAIERDIPVIPVLTPDAELTANEPLPVGLERLRAERQFPLSVAFWDTAVDAIVGRLKEVETALKTRIDAMVAATGQLRSAEDAAKRAKRDHEKSLNEIEKWDRSVSDQQAKARRASDEEARLNDEQPDQNAAYLKGPGAIEPDPVPRPLPVQLPPRAIAIVVGVIVLIVIVVIAAGH